MAYMQQNRLIAIDTPLGADALLLQGFTGQEGMSQLFHFHLDLLSENPAIPFNKIVGQRVTLHILLADGSQRSINGCVSRFAQTGNDMRFTHYRAEVVPWLWFLTRTANCRIFQNMTVPDIILKIFKDLDFSDVKNALQGSFEPRDYCVQYRETAFHFVSRLMEQEGIFYFFEHKEDKHTLVLANSPNAHHPCPEQPQARYDYSAGALLEEDVITSWQMEQELRPGKYALTDYNFETPSTSLAANTNSIVNVGNNGKFEVYDYPGAYLKKAQGEQLVKLRMEEEEASHMVVSGASTCRAFLPGYYFDLQGHPCQDMNQAYVLTQVQHEATMGDSYSGEGTDAIPHYTNHFSCIPRKVPYRPPRITPRPTVQGPQTAVVVGKTGEEIWTDKYGRVKVQFHWDREGKRDENSSCWVRVSHPWAGKGWGSVSIPRIGQEVIIDFLEGDPDQPIITGRVYNAEQMPPYGLPSGGMVSGLKSNTTPGGGGHNEMSMNDTKGKEMITIHAQYDMNTTVQHDQTNTVNNKFTETIKNDATIKITEGKYSHDVVANTASYHVQGALTEKYDATQDTTVKGNITTKSTTGAIVISADASSIYIHAATNIELHTGASKLKMASDGRIELTGINIAIKGAESVNIKGGAITSEAQADHNIKGNILVTEGVASNTVKGGMVMLNP